MAMTIKLVDWPEPDRRSWEEACWPHVRLRRGGRAAHMKPVTRDDLARRFGLFLGFLERSGRLDRSLSALNHVTPHIIERYVAELTARVSSVTVHGSTYKLRRIVEILDPSFDVDWLKEIERGLLDLARPKPKTDKLVLSNRIFEAGVELIKKARTESRRTSLQRARSVRDGLLIAFLAVCPIRLKNVAALRLGENIAHQHGQWWLLLSDTETKAKRRDHRVIPEILAPWIDLYMKEYKPIFPSSAAAMWPSQYGGAMSPSGVQRLVTQTTKKALGIAIGPHMFRHCAPYTIANSDGSKIHLASALLQHRDARTTEKYYNLGHSVESSKLFAEIISNLTLPSADKESGPVATYEPIPNRKT
jgi:integrase